MKDATVTTDELATELQNPDWVILDCRHSLAEPEAGEAAWTEAHIPGSIYAHLDRDLSSPITPASGRHPLPERDALVARFRDWGINNHTQLIAVDAKVSSIAARLWWLARWLGHEQVAVLDGGMAAWREANLPLDNLIPEPVTGDFSASDSVMTTVDIDAVASGDYLLLDARDAYRYRGESEPIDKIPGHIPGALNRPFQQNVDETGRFLSADTLRQAFTPLCPAVQDKPLAHYCGSGVTATHNQLAMHIAGLEPGSLYPGSFSEWARRDRKDYPVVGSDQ